jgi:hypothetical protein
MKCVQAREQLMEACAAPEMASAEARQHLSDCAACSAEWTGMKQVMALLDVWQAPEPSPYFSTRLRARVREEAAQPVGMAARLRAIFGRNAALASAMALLLFGGAMMFRSGTGSKGVHPMHDIEISSGLQIGTPSGDLKVLDKNFDMYANFDLLDDVSPAGNAGVSE